MLRTSEPSEPVQRRESIGYFSTGYFTSWLTFSMTGFGVA